MPAVPELTMMDHLEQPEKFPEGVGAFDPFTSCFVSGHNETTARPMC